MKRPDKVSVLGSRYKIQYVDGAPLDPDDLGECDSVKHLISIRDGKPLQTEQRTVIHESLEAMNLTALIGLRHTQIEQLEQIAERAAEKALERVYTQIGKSVVNKILWLIGAASLAAFAYMKGAGKA